MAKGNYETCVYFDDFQSALCICVVFRGDACEPLLLYIVAAQSACLCAKSGKDGAYEMEKWVWPPIKQQIKQSQSDRATRTAKLLDDKKT